MEEKVFSEHLNNNNHLIGTSGDRRNYEFDESVNSIVSNHTPTKGGRPEKKRNSTPVRRIFKKLFVCNSSKKKKAKDSSVLSTSSSEGYRGYPLDGHCSTSSSPDNLKYLASSESGTVAETTTTQSTSALSNLTEEDSILQSPPRKAKLSSMKDPTAIPLPDSPVGAFKSQQLMHEILPTSPENMEDQFFLPEESSSSGSDGPSPISTPTHHAMRSPGMAIPTPQTRSSPADESRGVTGTVLFPHPLRTISETPRIEPNRSVNQSIDEEAFLPDDFTKSTFTREEVQRRIFEAETQLRDHLEDRHQHAIEELQEEAEKSLQEHGKQWKADSEREFERMESKLREERVKTQQKHRELINKTTEMAEIRQQLQNFSLEREEYESYIASLEAQLKERSQDGDDGSKELQRQELDREFQELQEQMNALRDQEKAGEIEALKSTHYQELQELKQVNIAAKRRAEELQRQLESVKHSMVRSPSRATDTREQEHLEELRHLQASKEEANRQVLALRDQLDALKGNGISASTEDHIVLKAEKVAAERRLTEMQGCIDTGAEAKIAAQSSLRKAQIEIESLKRELATLRADASSRLDESISSEVSHEELFIARAEVETLRVLREEDEVERQAQLQAIVAERDVLKSKLKKVKQQYQIELSSPRRRGRESTLNIHAMTVEVEESPRNDTPTKDNTAEKQLKVLGQNFAKLQAEKQALEMELRKAEEAQSEAVQSAIREAELKIQGIKEEMERKEKEHEAEKRNIRADLSVAEIAELTAEVQALQNRHQTELKQLKQQVAADLEKAIQIERESAEKSRLRFDEERKQVEARYKEGIRELESKIQALRDEHEEELQTLKSKSKEEAEQELQHLQDELKKLRIEFEGEKIEIVKTSAEEHEGMMLRLDEIRENNSLEVEAVRSEAREKMEEEIKSLRDLLEAANEKAQLATASQLERDEFRLQVEALKKQLLDSESTGARVSEQYINEMQAKFEEELEVEKEKAQIQISALQKTLEMSTADKRKLLARLQVLATKLDESSESHQKELDLVKKQSQEAMDRELEALEETIKTMEMGDSDAVMKAKQLQEDNNTLRLEVDLRVQKLRDDHTKEIDEIVGQLDLVEAEHREKSLQQEQVIHGKDAVISALGSQLAEAQSRLAAVTEGQESIQKELENLTEQLNISRAETAARNEDINRLLAEHRQSMEDQEILREQACVEAKEEMIKMAEVQFEQRNQHYKKLKQEFDNAVSKIAALEAELKVSKTEAAEARRRQEALEIEMADELAQAKAATAVSDLNAARKLKQYRTELEESKAIEAELRRKLDEAKTTSQSIQSTFAGIISEKEKLIQENNELQAVCEDLMAEIEGQAGK
eukprot:CAMPEP_0117019248 /NCGR_PEP_ID=MMETSP0472-20121206/14802_1 /TAXON_ID=693140 ORGANISM="Tiarina fusus, Strain LIS" /NCGR_SAMPLE_ID=MMETSP0472 /ASSEMBLY_ACC=CAM_ASM_000603 /LENGTH=1356 /DNA_ID=CAMNT_0004724175 /DNA_START=96 /DNA_END=4166 /DNA_ORIENTATION=+